MLTKSDVKTFSELQVLARYRASVSLMRNDPIAHAYWRETELWAVGKEGCEPKDPDCWLTLARFFVDKAAKCVDRPMEAALFYSRAKWIVILARNNGIKMDPKVTRVNLSWLRKVAG